MKKWITALFICLSFNVFAQESEFLPVAEAFKFHAEIKDNNLEMHWDISEGYYLYRSKISALQNDKALDLNFKQDAVIKDDEFFGTRWPRHQKQASRPLNELTHNRRQPKLLEGEEFVRDSPQNHSDHAALFKHGHSKPSLVTKREAEVCSTAFLQLLLVAFRRDGLHQSRCVFFFERFGFQANHMPALANYGRLPHRNVQVTYAVSNNGFQQFVDL